MSKQINISDPLARKLNGIRETFDCSYSEAIVMLGKGENHLKSFILTRTSEIRGAVEKKHSHDVLVMGSLTEFVRATALVLQAVTNVDRINEHNEKIEPFDGVRE